VEKRVKQRRQAQRGAALVIAIFTLMLISVVATAMILMADSETALKGNYKSAMQAFYDAKAGLEEARGRLWGNNADSLPVRNCAVPGGGNMPLGQVCYIVNPSPGEVVNPLDLSAGNPYADFEYRQEWGTPVTSAAVQLPFINSTSAVAGAGIAGPLYKWVRITPRTEVSANFDSDGDGVIDNTSLFAWTPPTSNGIPGINTADSKNVIPPGAAQILTITALAVTPYGSRRMLQYTVAAPSQTGPLVTFPSALTLAGNGVSFTGPTGGTDDNGNGNGGGNNTFRISGNDSSAPPPSGVSAIGYTNSSDGSNAGIAAAAASNNYVSPSGIPNVGLVALPTLFQTPSGLDSLVQSITQSADLVLNPPAGTTADQTSLASMSATNPMIVVVNGDFHLTHASGGSFTGYGLLLVTGTLHYDPDDSWNGIILVIGQGVFDGSQHGNGGQINGSIFVANTRDNSGNLLASLGPASFSLTGGGNGIRYNSQVVTTTEALTTYQVLSFREISQTTP
jgi:hypothetical protein